MLRHNRPSSGWQGWENKYTVQNGNRHICFILKFNWIRFKLTLAQFTVNILGSHSSVAAHSCLLIFILPISFPHSGNKPSENAAKLKYLGMLATNKNCIPADVKIGLKWSNISYHSVQCPFCFWFSCWLAGGASLTYRKHHAVGRDQTVTCATKFQFSTFCSTFQNRVEY